MFFNNVSLGLKMSVWYDAVRLEGVKETFAILKRKLQMKSQFHSDSVNLNDQPKYITI